MRLVVVVFSVLAVLGMSAPTAFAANENSAANCAEVVAKQAAKGIAAGGGPKEGILAPTNCDHFFQDVGLIGNGTPPGQQP